MKKTKSQDTREVVQRGPSCPNLNHGKANAPVRFCPGCGEVVNKGAVRSKCDATVHAQRMKQREKYCVDCGVRLA